MEVTTIVSAEALAVEVSAEAIVVVVVMEIAGCIVSEEVLLVVLYWTCETHCWCCTVLVQNVARITVVVVLLVIGELDENSSVNKTRRRSDNSALVVD